VLYWQKTSSAVFDAKCTEHGARPALSGISTVHLWEVQVDGLTSVGRWVIVAQ
jgi:hypothetical protein